VYSGNEIKEVKASVDYNDGEHQGKVFDNIWISYTWEEFGEQDIELGMNLLLVGGFATAIALLVVILVDVQVKFILSQQTATVQTDSGQLMSAYDSFPTLGMAFGGGLPQERVPPTFTDEGTHSSLLTQNREAIFDAALENDSGVNPLEMGSFINDAQSYVAQPQMLHPLHQESSTEPPAMSAYAQTSSPKEH